MSHPTRPSSPGDRSGPDEALHRLGAVYDPRRQFLRVGGIIVRQLGSLPLAPRPKRGSRALAFDDLGGNTTLGIHLTEVPPGGERAGHRHLDEATFYIVDGRGWTELRQRDDAPLQRVEWETGDIVAIPANAWHQHFNADPHRPARQLAFKNTRLLRRLFHSRSFVYDNPFRFSDRYDDEPDYWTRREVGEDGRVRQNVVRGALQVPLDPVPEAGEGVRWQRLVMGGHRLLEHVLVELEQGGYLRPHRPLVEEAFLVLAGGGRTHLWDEEGQATVIRWRAGDLFAPPFGLWRQHVQEGPGPARLFWVRNTVFQRALGLQGEVTLDGAWPRRFLQVVEAGRSLIEDLAAAASREMGWATGGDPWE
jgi:quercetin dioxygenase-like cupin family protein